VERDGTGKKACILIDDEDGEDAKMASSSSSRTCRFLSSALSLSLSL
jgi:hypothetical protein